MYLYLFLRYPPSLVFHRYFIDISSMNSFFSFLQRSFLFLLLITIILLIRFFLTTGFFFLKKSKWFFILQVFNLQLTYDPYEVLLPAKEMLSNLIENIEPKLIRHTLAFLCSFKCIKSILKLHPSN